MFWKFWKNESIVSRDASADESESEPWSCGQWLGETGSFMPKPCRAVQFGYAARRSGNGVGIARVLASSSCIGFSRIDEGSSS